MSALRDDHHSQPKAWTPWGGAPIAFRPVQPFGVQIQTATAVVPTYGLGGSPAGAFLVPFHPFPIEPFGSRQDVPGSVASFDRHERSERKFPHDGKAGTRPGNLTARKRNAC